MSTAVTEVFAPRVPLADLLPRFELFAGLTQDQINWFASNAVDEIIPAGKQFIQPGDEAVQMNFIVEGLLRFQTSGPGNAVFLAHAGLATGLLPYSRLTRFQGTAHAITDLRLASVHRDKFNEMFDAIPPLRARLIAVMSDRIREATRIQEQREKLNALGKLAAGLAHELNNPASAALRAAQDLRAWSHLLRDSNQSLAEHGFDAEQFRCLLEFERETIAGSMSGRSLDVIERTDLEEKLAEWLESHSVARASEFAPLFVDAGVGANELRIITDCFAPGAAALALTRIAATLAIDRLTCGIQASTNQISELVSAVKGYSFVDQAPQQDVDIVVGIEDTLHMFGHRLRDGVEIVRDYQPDLPRITAHGSELNQVWTHLIDNALDAMYDHGILTIRCHSEAGMVLAEIGDTGVGIPQEIQDRIFDPFFTTKDVGAGRGLGLDRVYRILQKHRGDIRFTSLPGDTVFQVRLPVQNVSTF